MNVIASWSGGKDSCLACYRAMQEGYNVTHILNTVSAESGKVRFHELRDDLIKKQADSIGAGLLQVRARSENYDGDVKAGLLGLISETGVRGLVRGDIHLEMAREWAEKLCKDVGLDIIEPLWNDPPENLLAEFIESGFEACIVACSDELMGEEFIGRKLDRQFLKDALDIGIDVCGENGEYHSVVTGGPIFKERIEIRMSEPVLRDGRWYIDITGK